MTVIVDTTGREIKQQYTPHMKHAFLFNAINGTFIYAAQHRLVNVRNIMRG
jgi:hypothetical protein